MKSLIFANQKGGVGKTSILVHMAFYFAEAGRMTVVLDIDHQQNATFTLTKYSVGIPLSSVLTNPE